MYKFVFLTDFNASRPSGHQRALGAYVLSSMLEKNFLSSFVLDFFFSYSEEELRQISNKLISKDTLAICLSTTFLYSRSTNVQPQDLERKFYFFVSHAKKINPHIKVFVGGAGKTFGFSEIDAIFEGQYKENQFLEYLQEIFSIPNLKNFDFHNDEFSFRHQDIIYPKETLPIEISRGCMFSCRFCSFSGRGRKLDSNLKNFSIIKKQLSYYYTEFGSSNFYLVDDTFNDSMNKLGQLQSVVQDLKYQPSFVAYIRIDLLMKFPEMLPLLKNIGVKGLFFGLETFHPEAAKTIGKYINLENLKNYLKFIRKEHPDLHLSASFIAGLPHEKLDDISKTNEWLVQNKVVDNWYFSPLTVDTNKNNPYRSYFSDHIHEHGYKVYQDGSWERNDLTFSEVMNFSTNINYGNKDYITPSSWIIFSLLHEHSFEDVRKAKYSELGSFESFSKFKFYKSKMLGANQLSFNNFY